MSDETITPIIRDVPIPPDDRLIADMPFEGEDVARALLQRCQVQFAYDIEALGCTGAHAHGLTIEEITSLRLGLAGGGVGLPCFVGSDRFCLAHNTIGGLQDGQKQRYPEEVTKISRELTPEEKGKVAYTETVRRSGKGSVADQMAAAGGALSGFGELPRGTELVEDTGEAPIALPPGIPMPALSYGKPFVCPEHVKLVWACRFCVAQAIVEGELAPVFGVHFADKATADAAEEEILVMVSLTEEDLEEEIAKADAAGHTTVEVYALVKTLTRKLS